MKRFIVLILAILILFSVPAFAQAVPTSGVVGDNIIWAVDDGVLTIHGSGKLPDFDSDLATPWYPYIHNIEKIIVGDGLNHIGRYSFKNFDALKSVVLSDSIESIGFAAFANCYELCEINTPKSLKILSNGAFSEAWALKEFYIPEKVEAIYDYVFYNTLSLEKIIVSENNPYYESDELGVLFTKGKKELIKMPEKASTESYIIPNSVEKIANFAFERSNLKEVKFTNDSKLTEIEGYAFRNSKLKEITLPDTVTALGAACFSYCLELKSITLSPNITKIPEDALSVSAFEEITLPEKLEVIERFGGNANLKRISFPQNIKRISTIVNCPLLEELHLPASVERFEGVSDCSSLKKISVAAENKSYSSDEYGVLFNKDKTELLYFPMGSELELYKIPETVTALHPHSFEKALKIKQIIIPNGVTRISPYTFFSASSLETVTLPESIENIENSAFAFCSNLKNIYFEGNPQLKKIGMAAFNKTGIEEFYLPDSVEAIYMSAFAGCEKLRSFYVTENSRLNYAENNYTFTSAPYVTVYAPKGSYMENYAIQNNVNIPIPVAVNGKIISFPTPPRIQNDRTLVPIRAICEALSANVSWNIEENCVIVQKDDVTIKLKSNSNILYVNGKEITLDAKSIVVDERLLIPLRAFSEAFNCKVLWDAENRSVEIKMGL